MNIISSPSDILYAKNKDVIINYASENYHIIYSVEFFLSQGIFKIVICDKTKIKYRKKNKIRYIK